MNSIAEQRDERIMYFIVTVTLMDKGYGKLEIVQKNFTIEEPSPKRVFVLYDEVFTSLVIRTRPENKYKPHDELYHRKWYNN